MGNWQFILVVLMILLFYALVIILLIDIYKGQFKRNKWMWFVIVLLFNYPGAIFYLLIGRQEKIKS
jgi:hypothetical protein